MEFAEVSLLMQQFIERKRAEAGADDSPVDDALLKLVELLEKIREEKKQAADERRGPAGNGQVCEVPTQA